MLIGGKNYFNQSKTTYIQNKYIKEIETHREKLTSGKRIINAKEDPSNIRRVSSFEKEIRGTNKSIDNIEHGVQAMNIIDGALNSVTNLMQRMRELALMAKNETYSNEDRNKYQVEIEQLKKEITQISRNTDFNGVQLLGPSSKEISNSNGGVDIVFVIDNTGSMSSLQNEVAQNIQSFIDTLKGFGVNDYRLGVVEYTDSEVNFSSFTSGQWTSDSNEVKTEIERLATLNRGGTENIMDAISQTISNYSFRSNAPGTINKHIVFVSNEDADDGSNTSTVLNELQTKGIQVHGVYDFSFTDAANPKDTQEFESLINGTEGSSVNINSATWANELVDVVGTQISRSASNIKFDRDLKLHIGATFDDVKKIDLFDARLINLGIDNINVLTTQNAEDTIIRIDKAINQVAEKRSYFGANQNRLQETINYSNEKVIRDTETKSRIEDTDMAKEYSELTKKNILAMNSVNIIKNYQKIGEEAVKLLIK